MENGRAHDFAALDDPRSLRTLARRVPDTEAWVDLRGPLIEGSARVFEDGEGFVMRSVDYPYAAVFGRPGDAVVQQVAATGREVEDFRVLAAADAAGWLGEVLPGWPSQEVLLHRRPVERDGAWAELPEELMVSMYWDEHSTREQDEELKGISPSVHAELRVALGRGKPLAIVHKEVEGRYRAAAFCYAAFRTETLWDVAIETLPEFRRQGLATWGFEVLAGELRDRGLAPVWGAYDDNPASLALATKLGFRITARLVALRPPATATEN